jgi:non-ribosomal peptide synthase protein (TIGR01720 family)
MSDNSSDIAKLEASLQSKLPKHYWPDHLLQIEEFPLMANGKTNIKDLQKRKVEVQSSKQISVSESNPLLQIWKEVLNNENIGINDNFFEVGGDSIQLIRIVAKARKAGIQLSAKDIYNNQTVASLLPKQSQVTPKSLESTPWKYLPLTPIQAWFFEEYQSHPDHWLQGYRLKLTRPQTVQVVKDIIKQLIDTEAIFRVLFTKLYGKWHMAHSSNSIDDYIELTKSSKLASQGISLTQGPLIKFVLDKDGDKVTSVNIIAHHAIIDAVSWHHILNRFNDGLGSKEIAYTRISEDFLHWTREINLYAQTNLFDSDLTFWQDQIGRKSPYFESKGDSVEGNVKTVKLKIPAKKSRDLIGSLGNYSSIKLNEAIIAAFARSFYQVTGEESVTLMLEGHGRDASFTELDLSEAIGWFTSYYPVTFTLSNSNDELQSLIDVKEQVRQVPNKGISYGALRYLSGKLKGESNAYVTINHLGDLSQSHYEHLSEVTFLNEGMRSPLSERQSLLEINTHIDHGELVLNYSYDAVLLDNQEMEDILNEMHSYLVRIPETLSARETRVTPSDFNYVLSRGDLDHILENNDAELETIIPLTSTQSALLFHHLQAGSSDQGLIKASVILHGQVDQSRLQDAWQTLVETHDILRSYFLWEGLENSVQVVAKSIKSTIVFHDAQGMTGEQREEFFQQIIDEEWSKFKLNSPPIYRIICIKESDTLHHLILLCHHIYIDGWSTNVLFKDLVQLYISSDKQKVLHRPKLINWYQQVESHRKAEDLKDYWERTMSTASPSLLKSPEQIVKNEFAIDQFALSQSQTSRLLNDIKSERLTLSVVLTGLWSWLLSQYLDQSVVSMGMIHSGRSVEIDGVDNLVGMLSRVLPMISTHTDRSQIDFAKIQNDFNEVLKRDAISIDDIPGLDQSKVRYDTLLIIENFMTEQAQSQQLQYTDFKSNISSLMPLCVIVVPGDQMTFKLRYNVHQYSTEEISHIREDILSVLKGLQFNGKIATTKSEQLYKPVLPTLTLPIIGEAGSQFDDELNLDEALLLIWKDVLNDQSITLQDNFFELGGTSLMAVRIFNAINKQFGINASPILLLKHKTITQLASVLQTSSVEESWKCLHPLSEAGDGEPLFCFHAGEGHILFYNELAQNITNRPVYGIQPVGLDGEQMQFESIEEMATYYLTQIKAVYPSGPYHLLGTCFSNAVTFEMASQLKDEMGQLIFVDSPPPYFNELSKLKKWMSWVYTFNVPKLWEAFNNYFKYSTLKAPTDEQERNLFNTGKQLRTIMSTYKWMPQDLEIVLIRSKENADDTYKSYHIDNWQLLAKRGVVAKTISGKHLTIFEGQSAIEMGEVIESILSVDV